MIPANFRGAVADDLNLLLNSWLMSYRNAPAVKTVPNDVYFADGGGQRQVVLDLLEVCPTLVACAPEDESTIFGWACADPVRHVLHFAFVKEAYRGMRVFARLLEQFGMVNGPLTVTHFTRATARMKERGRTIIHDPFILRRIHP